MTIKGLVLTLMEILSNAVETEEFLHGRLGKVGEDGGGGCLWVGVVVGAGPVEETIVRVGARATDDQVIRPLLLVQLLSPPA